MHARMFGNTNAHKAAIVISSTVDDEVGCARSTNVGEERCFLNAPPVSSSSLYKSSLKLPVPLSERSGQTWEARALAATISAHGGRMGLWSRVVGQRSGGGSAVTEGTRIDTQEGYLRYSDTENVSANRRTLEGMMKAGMEVEAMRAALGFCCELDSQQQIQGQSRLSETVWPGRYRGPFR
eukprot:5350675-Pleurochrysis_carterae.AAC.1